ncbi:hypothetical protein HII17_14385 [Thalassotalea sp. M1531]|uniref:Uncharacterized protein n=1 Tax=Thalassotalea algicola TaxID=2716224 RepID=A0A7Y0LDV7_9GAMM|nr:hypothetical protein [Thalassotalea algicola]NMP32745.1 hypothetical protein [Thalassotalea algicola]
MKNLLSLLTVFQQLLTLMIMISIIMVPIYFELSMTMTLTAVPIMFLLMSWFSIYYDQKLISWRDYLRKHEKLDRSQCKISACWLHNA